MSWQAGSTRVYSQPSNQGFPGTRQSTQLLAADREGGSVAGYWQTLFESASEETFIYLKMLSPFPPARFVDWYVHCWTDSLSSEKYFGVIQATIISIKVSGYVLPIQWKQAASPQNRNHPTKLLQQRISIMYYLSICDTWVRRFLRPPFHNWADTKWDVSDASDWSQHATMIFWSHCNHALWYFIRTAHHNIRGNELKQNKSQPLHQLPSDNTSPTSVSSTPGWSYSSLKFNNQQPMIIIYWPTCSLVSYTDLNLVIKELRFIDTNDGWNMIQEI